MGILIYLLGSFSSTHFIIVLTFLLKISSFISFSFLYKVTFLNLISLNKPLHYFI